jgi:hypothetical protein
MFTMTNPRFVGIPEDRVFMAITRTPPPANAGSQVKRDYKELLSNLAKCLELHKGLKKRLKEASKLRPLILDNPEAKLMQGYKRKHHGIVTDNEKDLVKDWLFNTCPLVSALPYQRDEIIVGKCPVTGEWRTCERTRVFVPVLQA